MKQSKWTKKQQEARRIYAVYDAVTDELLAFGNSTQCANVLGYRNAGSFRKTVWAVDNGKIKKYVILKMDGYEDDEDGSEDG